MKKTNTMENKYARRCDATGKGMNQGYVVGGGEFHFSEQEHLISHLKSLDWVTADGLKVNDVYTDEVEFLEFFYEGNHYYYTEWVEVDDDHYYDEKGILYITY